MAHTRNLAPRKVPVQDRSRDTVERILASAKRVLAERGYDCASTNRIAAEARISPGSLYQYFPNKDAIVSAVVDQYARDVRNRVTHQLRDLLDDEPTVLVPTALDALVSALAEHRELLRTLVEQVPGGRGVELLAGPDSAVGDMTRGYLMHRRHLFGDSDLTAVTWIVVRVAGSLTVRYVLDQPPIAQAVFVEELSRLVLGYPSHRRAHVAVRAVTESAPTQSTG